MELSTRDKQNLLSKVKRVKWTNRYDCPPGYTFNDDGWIETLSAYPKITVNFLPYLFNKLGEYQILLQNLLALRLLNEHSHATLEKALWNRYTQARFGQQPDKKVFDLVVVSSKEITNTAQLPVFDENILSMDTIWYSESFNEAGIAAIKKKLRNNYISAIRLLMPINKKYKTTDVMVEADVSKYAVNQYWKENKLDKKARTLSSIVEAVTYLSEDADEVSLKSIATLSGVSVRSIQRYKDMWKLNT
jgi:hypothetical protein